MPVLHGVLDDSGLAKLLAEERNATIVDQVCQIAVPADIDIPNFALALCHRWRGLGYIGSSAFEGLRVNPSLCDAALRMSPKPAREFATSRAGGG